MKCRKRRGTQIGKTRRLGTCQKVNGNKKVCIARWNSKTWKMEFLKEMMGSSKLWRSIRSHWNIMINSHTPDGDFDYETDEEPKNVESDNYWSGNDDHWSANDDYSGGDEEWRGAAH